MLLLNLILLIEVTFSTPTGNYTNNPVSVMGCCANYDLHEEVGIIIRREHLKARMNFMLASRRPSSAIPQFLWSSTKQ
jgi:hypothetical protein